MKLVFLDTKTIGEDIDLSAYDALGEVVKYGFSTLEEIPERVKDADVLIGGRYGMGSKDTNPAQIKAVYDHLNSDNPFNSFTIGIVDDVTHLSLPTEEFNVTGDYTECLFYGLGSDGTVSANKSSIKIIGDHTDLYSQAYFAYDSKKAGGTTRSNLRFGASPIRATYYVNNADFILIKYRIL